MCYTWPRRDRSYSDRACATAEEKKRLLAQKSLTEEKRDVLAGSAGGHPQQGKGWIGKDFSRQVR